MRNTSSGQVTYLAVPIALPKRLLLLVCVWLVGMAHILLLPPWEGYDETAHWSYIQELSDTLHTPKQGIDRLSADLDGYAGPLPYNQANRSAGHPPYQQFAAAPDSFLGTGPTSYKSSGPVNWEAQHPPLFYALMVPVYRLTKAMDWKMHLLALRASAWMMASLALLVLTLWTPEDLSAQMSTTSAVLIWPLVVPEFFPEMARLGNDCLCLLIASLLWVLVLRSRYRSSLIISIAIGFILGAGLLTKAFFVPITVGIAALIFTYNFRGGLARALAHFLTIIGIASCIAGSWYWNTLKATGVLGGGNEFAAAHQSGIWPSLQVKWAFLPFLKAMFTIISTATWAGTWSFTIFHAWIFLPLLLIPVLPIMRWLGRRETWTIAGAAPLFLLLPFVAGLIYHELAAIASGLPGPSTPGWYLHILLGPLTYAWAKGWKDSTLNRLLLAIGFCGTWAFWLAQQSIFSGSTRLDSSGHIPLDAAWWQLKVEPLVALEYPFAAVLLLGCAAITALVLVRRMPTRRFQSALPQRQRYHETQRT